MAENIPEEIVKDLQSVCQLFSRQSATMTNAENLAKAYLDF
jgi:hypothetical protein